MLLRLIFLIAPPVLGFALIGWGYYLTVQPGQSEDVRVGGVIPIVLGIAVLVLYGAVCLFIRMMEKV